MLRARAQTPAEKQSCMTGAPGSRCSCKYMQQSNGVVDKAVTCKQQLGLADTPNPGARAAADAQPRPALRSAATACSHMYATVALLIRGDSSRHCCIHVDWISIAAASSEAAAAAAAGEYCRPSRQLPLHVTHHAGVMLLYMHGVGSLARSSSEVYQPMPNPSPLRLPNPRWLGSDGSCKRSRASYDCLMIDRSGPAHAHARQEKTAYLNDGICSTASNNLTRRLL
jgi:hypothetical protein